MLKFRKQRQELVEEIRELNTNLSRAVTLLEKISSSVDPVQMGQTLDRLLEGMQKVHTESAAQVTPRQILNEWMLEEEERRGNGDS